MGTTQSVPKESPLGRLLERWRVYGHRPMTKKKMISYCNKVWPTYVLESEERWPLNGSLNYYTISHLESFCKRAGKWDELSYIEAFMYLHKKDAAKEGNMLRVPCRSSLKPPPLADSKPKPPPADSKPKPPPADSKPKPPPADSKPKPPPADSKTQKGKRNEETPPPASQNPGTRTPRQGGSSYPPLPPPRSRVDVGNQGTQATKPPPSCDEQTATPSRTSQGTQCGLGARQTRGTQCGPGARQTGGTQCGPGARQIGSTQCGPRALQTGAVPTGLVPCQLRQLPVGGTDQQDQLMGYYWARTPFSVSDLLKWKADNPSYREDPQKTTDFFSFIFSTHQPNWADVEALLHILLTSDERQLVREKAIEEACRLYRENPNGTPFPAGAVPFVDPHWDPNRGGLLHLEHYRRCILEGLRRGVTKKKCLDPVLAIQQQLEEDPADFLERLYQAYRKYTNIDPEAAENVSQVRLSFISQSAPYIRRKLEALTGAFEMNLEQLVSIATSDSRRRMGTQQPIIIFLGPEEGWKETKRRRPLGPNQCAYCKEEGHWKRECPRLALKACRNALRNRMIEWYSDSDEE